MPLFRTISLGKYGSFPSNLVIHRPFHLTYEIQTKREGEEFSRLRVVSAEELRADILGDENPGEAAAEIEATADADDEPMTLEAANKAVGEAVEKAAADPTARQMLTTADIEELKREGASAGRGVIAKLLASHTALDEKTAYSLDKYKLLKTRKYIRRFEVMPLDTPLFTDWLLEEKDGARILELRQEMLALLGCWGNVHRAVDETEVVGDEGTGFPEGLKAPTLTGGRWLVVDDTGGLLVAAMAERMGLLHPNRETAQPTKPAQAAGATTDAQPPTKSSEDAIMKDAAVEGNDVPADQPTEAQAAPKESAPRPADKPRSRRYDRDDLDIPYAGTNTLTLIHANSQPNLASLKYYDFDFANPNPPFAAHPLHTNLTWLSWLQLLDPQSDSIYTGEPPAATAEEMQLWKGNRRGQYHRKRRRWARTRFIVDSARAGGFSGFVSASTLDPVSLLRNVLPLLAPGAPIAIYSQSIEALANLADIFSVARRTGWSSDPPPEAEGLSREELERWEGSEDFPINPTLLLAPAVQTSRVRHWQVLPGRTHPLMTGRGGTEGYVFTAWKTLPAEGKVEARGRHKRRKVGGPTPGAAA